MSTFEVGIRVGHMVYGDMVGVNALVDTEVIHAVLPSSFLETLGVEPDLQVQVAYADGEVREAGSGEVRIAYNGMERVCPVIFGNEDIYLVGKITLEILNLTVDPVHEVLTSAPPIRGRPF